MIFKKLPFQLLISLCAVTICTAQNFTLYKQQLFGGNMQDIDLQMIEFNNKLVIAGRSMSLNPSGNKTTYNCIGPPSAFVNSDIWMVMLDTALNIIWQKSLGGSSSEYGLGSLIKTSDNHIMFACQSRSDSSCQKSENCKTFPFSDDDIWICKLDSMGNVTADKTFGSMRIDIGANIVELSDGNFIVVANNSAGTGLGPNIGYDKTVANIGEHDYWIIKFDNNLNKIWDNVYGGTEEETMYPAFGNSTNCTVTATENGSFVLAGNTRSPVSGSISQPPRGNDDLWIIKIDSAGNKVWDRRYGGSGDEGAASIIKIADGFMLLSGTNSPQGGDITNASIGGFDIWILKLDSMGNKLWDKRFGGTNSDFVNEVLKSNDNGYYISGGTISPVGFDVTEPSFSPGWNDFWFFKIDSSGNKLWDKRLGGPGVDNPSNFVLMPDSSIFLCGYADTGTSAVKTDYGFGMLDFWVLHFKYTDGNTGISAINNNLRTIVFPNPVKNNLQFTLTAQAQCESIEITTALGQLVYQQNTNAEKREIDISNFKPGIYTLKIKTNWGNAVSTFIKE